MTLTRSTFRLAIWAAAVSAAPAHARPAQPTEVEANAVVDARYVGVDARFFEYRSTGPGAQRSPTRRQLSDGDARSYSPALVLDGWSPEASR